VLQQIDLQARDVLGLHEIILRVTLARRRLRLGAEASHERVVGRGLLLPVRGVQLTQGDEEIVERFVPEGRFLHAAQEPTATSCFLPLGAVLHDFLEA